MKTNLYLSFLLALVVSLLFYSCKDNNIVNGEGGFGNVNGVVRDNYGNPVYPAVVWLNYTDSVFVNMDGTFSFENVTFPYNLTIKRPDGYEIIFFRTLTTHTPKLSFNTSFSPVNTNQAVISVKFTAGQGIRTIFDFISVRNCSYIPTSQSDSSMRMRLEWSGEPVITGKIALLQYRLYPSGRIYSYERFGYKDTIISSGDSVYLRLTSSDLQINPPENTLTFVMPAGIKLDEAYLYISFEGYGRNSDIFLCGISGLGIPLSYIVPRDLGLNFHIRSYIGYGQTHRTITGGYGGLVFVPNYSGVNPVSPPDGDSASYNSDFTYNGGNGVYVTRFFDINNYPEMYFIVVSGANSVKFPNLQYFGFNYPVGTNFAWGVTRYNDFSGINEFVSDKRITDLQYNITHNQQGRHFYLK